MKSSFPFVPISPFRMTDIFQSTNNLFSKVFCVRGPTSGQDIQEGLPYTIQRRSANYIPAIIRRPPKFIHFLPRRFPHCFVMVLIEHSRLITIPQEVEIGGCMTWRRL
jgi:hypothetical protein